MPRHANVAAACGHAGTWDGGLVEISASPVALLSHPIANVDEVLTGHGGDPWYTTTDAPWGVGPKRLEILRSLKRFIVRGWFWKKALGITDENLVEFTKEHSDGLFAAFCAKRPGWERFYIDWSDPGRGGDQKFGQGQITGFFKAHRRIERGDRVANGDSPALTFYKAIEFVYLCSAFLDDYCSDPANAAQFKEVLGVAYDPSFVFNYMWVEPQLFHLDPLPFAARDCFARQRRGGGPLAIPDALVVDINTRLGRIDPEQVNSDFQAKAILHNGSACTRPGAEMICEAVNTYLVGQDVNITMSVIPVNNDALRSTAVFAAEKVDINI